MTRHLRYLALLAVTSGASLLTACSDSTSPPALAASGSIASAAPGDSLAIGATITLNAQFTDTRGQGVSKTPTWTSSDTAVATVSATGSVLAVGLGEADITARVDTASAKRRVIVTRTGTANGWVNVATAFSNTCAITALGAAYCWGTNVGGQLGDSTTAASNAPRKVILPSDVRLTSITVASRMACGIARDGSAWCWGDNANFGIGSASVLKNTIATRVNPPTPLTFTALTTGSAHACALSSSGAVYCWGINSQGALGNGETGNSTVPVRVASAAGVTYTAIATASNASCAVTSSGGVQCWGFNDSGQLGNGLAETSRVPVTVSLPSGVAVRSLVGPSNGFHFCALTTTGDLYCWGRNVGGQFGIGTKLFANATPVLVPLPTGARVRAMSSGTTAVCIATTDGALWCQGSGSRGELGTGALTEQLSFAQVQRPTGTAFDIIRSGFQTTCAVSLTGELYCWGAGTSGQIGNGASADSSLPIKITLPAT
jgi:alpha-tubulin suppressor-like RCC1 family protein